MVDEESRKSLGLTLALILPHGIVITDWPDIFQTFLKETTTSSRTAISEAIGCTTQTLRQQK